MSRSESSSLRMYFVWIFPLIAISAGGELITDHPESGRYLGLAFGLGVAAGSTWQLAFPRDLTNRLTFVASCFVVSAVFGAVANLTWDLFDNRGAGLAAVGVLVGLIFTEHARRWRSGTQARNPVPGDGNSDVKDTADVHI